MIDLKGISIVRILFAAFDTSGRVGTIDSNATETLAFGPLSSSRKVVCNTAISSRVLEKARSGHYSLDRIDGIPRTLLKKYCLKGNGQYEGTLLIVKELRQRVEFHYSNLMAPTKGLGTFDIIFLRNVMIYFDPETKRKVINNLLPYLKIDGHLLIGHSETLNGITSDLVAVRRVTHPHASPKHT